MFGALDLAWRTDHRSHSEQDDAIAGYIRWRNQRGSPIRDFSMGSRI